MTNEERRANIQFAYSKGLNKEDLDRYISRRFHAAYRVAERYNGLKITFDDIDRHEHAISRRVRGKVSKEVKLHFLTMKFDSNKNRSIIYVIYEFGQTLIAVFCKRTRMIKTYLPASYIYDVYREDAQHTMTYDNYKSYTNAYKAVFYNNINSEREVMLLNRSKGMVFW